MRAVAIGGSSGTGKSTLMRAVIAELGENKPSKYQIDGKGAGLLYHWFPRALVLGAYEGDTRTPGTDRLPLNIQPVAEAFAYSWANSDFGQKVLLFEGDRLFNVKFLTLLQKLGELTIFVLGCEEEERQRRLGNRAQKASWQAGQATKLRNILEAFPEANRPRHVSPEDTTALVKRILMA